MAKKKATKRKPAKKAVKKAAPKKAVKKPAKKAVKKAPKKKVVKKKRKANPALMKPVTPSATLAVVIGSKPAPRGQMTKRLWDYIKKNKLQDPVKKTMIHSDENLKPIFGGKKVVSMFEMTKLVSKHIS